MIVLFTLDSSRIMRAFIQQRGFLNQMPLRWILLFLSLYRGFIKFILHYFWNISIHLHRLDINYDDIVDIYEFQNILDQKNQNTI